jgi:hypothetical protein
MNYLTVISPVRRLKKLFSYYSIIWRNSTPLLRRRLWHLNYNKTILTRDSTRIHLNRQRTRLYETLRDYIRLYKIPRRLHKIPRRVHEIPWRVYEIPRRVHEILWRVYETPWDSMRFHFNYIRTILITNSHLPIS